MRIRFLTSTPLDIRTGSGTYVGMHILARALRASGHEVRFETPQVHLRSYTAERLWFNRHLTPADPDELTVGFDMDGYRIAGKTPGYVAALKGVIADEVRFERGLTRLTMGIQARCERLQAQRSERVLVTSRYASERAQEFYHLKTPPMVVPELIDLAEWRGLLSIHEARPERFTVLYVGRLYRRKRVEDLVRAAAMLRNRIPEIEVRIVGDGPHGPVLHRMRESRSATWLGNVGRGQLMAEYNRAGVFCLPSEQEGFGIVLLEAMASGKPIVAARAAAIPEVVPHGVLVEPRQPEALAAAIEALYRSPERRADLARAGNEWVRRFDAPVVAQAFLGAATGAPEKITCNRA